MRHGFGLGNLEIRAFEPKNISGCVLWLRADLGVTQTAGAVSAWNDQSGRGHNFVQATMADQPAFQASTGPNSLPAIAFNGTSDVLTNADTAFLGADEFTIFCVNRFDNSGAAAEGAFVSFGSNSGASGYQLCLDPNSGKRSIVWAGETFLDDGGATLNWEVWVFSSHAGAQEFDVNGASQATFAASFTAPVNKAQLGSNDNGFFSSQVLHEVIAYNRKLTALEIQRVNDYIRARTVIW